MARLSEPRDAEPETWGAWPPGPAWALPVAWGLVVLPWVCLCFGEAGWDLTFKMQLWGWYASTVACLLLLAAAPIAIVLEAYSAWRDWRERKGRER